MKAVLSSLLFCAVALGASVIPSRRQSSGGSVVVTVFNGTDAIGNLSVADIGDTATVVPGADTLFSLTGDPGELIATSEGDALAFLVYQPAGDTCTGDGNLVFTLNPPETCAFQGRFLAFQPSGKLVVFDNPHGSFQVCGADQIVAFRGVESAGAEGCQDVQLVMA